MNFEQKVEKFLKNNGDKLLGVEGGLVFYEDKNGKVHASSEESIARAIRLNECSRCEELKENTTVTSNGFHVCNDCWIDGEDRE
jgi:hypothetical protein